LKSGHVLQVNGFDTVGWRGEEHRLRLSSGQVQMLCR